MRAPCASAMCIRRRIAVELAARAFVERIHIQASEQLLTHHSTNTVHGILVPESITLNNFISPFPFKRLKSISFSFVTSIIAPRITFSLPRAPQNYH